MSIMSSSSAVETASSSSDEVNLDVRMWKLQHLLRISSKNMAALLEKMDKIQKSSMAVLIANEIEENTNTITDKEPHDQP